MTTSRTLGFTLVELAIVLTIAGLLLAGLFMGGGAVLNGAKTSAMVSIINDVGTASRAFQSRYGYFPGDLPNATSVITTDGGISAGCSYAIGGSVANGLVDTPIESACALEHLVKARLISKAQLIGGTYVIPSPLGAGNVSLWHSAATNENTVRVSQVPCATALELDRKMDNASTNPLAAGQVLAQDSDGASVNTCSAGGANDPVAALLVKY